jgi:hypothetical protein
MTNARRSGYRTVTFGFVVATIAACDPYDPLCEIYMTAECIPDEPPPPDRPEDPPVDNEIYRCDCPDGWTVYSPDPVPCVYCPPPIDPLPELPPWTECECLNGSILPDCNSCPSYRCPNDGTWVDTPDECPPIEAG